MDNKRTYVKPEWRRFGMPTAAASCKTGGAHIVPQGGCGPGGSAQMCGGGGSETGLLCNNGFMDTACSSGTLASSNHCTGGASAMN